MKMKLIMLALMSVTIVTLVGCSKTGTIEGKVIDSHTKEPIEKVSVNIKGTTLSAITGKDGNFQIDDVVPGQNTVLVSKEGYSQSEPITIAVSKGVTSKLTSFKIACITETMLNNYKIEAPMIITNAINGRTISELTLKLQGKGTFQTDNDGKIKVTNLLPLKKYSINVIADGYLSDIISFRTQEIRKPVPTETVLLMPIAPRNGVYIYGDKGYQPIYPLTVQNFSLHWSKPGRKSKFVPGWSGYRLDNEKFISQEEMERAPSIAKEAMLVIWHKRLNLYRMPLIRYFFHEEVKLKGTKGAEAIFERGWYADMEKIEFVYKDSESYPLVKRVPSSNRDKRFITNMRIKQKSDIYHVLYVTEPPGAYVLSTGKLFSDKSHAIAFKVAE